MLYTCNYALHRRRDDAHMDSCGCGANDILLSVLLDNLWCRIRSMFCGCFNGDFTLVSAGELVSVS